MMRPSRHNVSCWLDGNRCDIARILTPHRSKRFSESFGALKELLPCGSCVRRLNGDVAKLAGLRLGKHERRILLAAPPPDREPIVVSAEGAGRSVSEVHRRAVRRLAMAGLIDMRKKQVEIETKAVAWSWGNHFSRTLLGDRVKRRFHYQAVVRTPLGQTVVQRLTSTLASGGVIRWAKHRATLVARTAQSPAALTQRFLAKVKNFAEVCACRRTMLALLHGHGGRRRAEAREQAVAEITQRLLACQMVSQAASRRRSQGVLSSRGARRDRHLERAHDDPPATPVKRRRTKKVT